MLNPFWKEKGYITSVEYRRFCGETVPLARFSKRVWTSNETLTARIDLSHFGELDLNQCAADWKLTDEKGKVISKGTLPAVDVPAGDLKTLGQINVKLNRIHAPTAVKLSVSIAGTKAANDWNLWVYPDTQDEAIGENVHMEQRPAARQLRKSLLDYAAGKSFNPTTRMTLDQVRGLLVRKSDSP